jgi:signal peptidase I
MTWKWFTSRTVRQARHASRHVQKLVHHQRDLLSQQAIDAVQADIAEVDGVSATGTKEQIRQSIAKLEKTANKWLKPYPNAGVRENVEVFLVAIAVAMGIRTFFLQPFKIPTGSMQPTLFGVTYENLRNQPDVKIPEGGDAYLKYWFNGMSFYNFSADAAGPVFWEQPTRFVLFNLNQKYRVGQYGKQHTIWFPPDQLFERAGLGVSGQTTVDAGQNFLRMRVISGDHLFVDRLSYNFRKPTRGDIIVFETHGITTLAPDQQNTYYIKRLIGLGGEHVRIGNDRHVVINGKRLDASTPHFEFVYSFDPKDAPRDSEFSGHVNELVAQRTRMFGGMLAPHFLTETNEFIVPPNHFLAMGDNTMSSSDGRTWGSFPQEKVIGKSFFVYWPIGGCEYQGTQRPSRFGWAHR